MDYSLFLQVLGVAVGMRSDSGVKMPEGGVVGVCVKSGRNA